MTVRTRMLIVVLCGSGVLSVAFGAVRLAAANARAERSAVHLRSVAREAQELIDLRGPHHGPAPAGHPGPDAVAALNRALADAGVPPDRLKDLSQESGGPMQDPPSAGGAGAPRPQTVRATLGPITVSETGLVLRALRSTPRAWIPTRLELARSHTNAAPGAYTLRMTLTAATPVGIDPLGEPRAEAPPPDSPPP